MKYIRSVNMSNSALALVKSELYTHCLKYISNNRFKIIIKISEIYY